MKGLHGAMKLHATSFPPAIALAASWDTALVRKVNRVTAAELRARGSQLTFSPVVDIARDPRWGRTEETFGEDTYLSATMGTAAVRGLQGSSDGSIDANHVGATLKHFAGHGQPEGGINQAPISIGERDFRNFHLRTFQLIIQQAVPAAIMPCYNSIDGIPAHANKWLLDDVLKKEWNYNGLVVSDWGGIGQLYSKHGVASSMDEAASIALKAGVDIDQPSSLNYNNLAKLVSADTTLLPYVDSAVARVLYLKFRVGLFEHSYINLAKIKAACNTEASKHLALEAASASMVLLKNKGHILPFNPHQYKKIVVIGPHADDMVLGEYSGVPTSTSTIYQGLKKRMGGDATVTYAKGCYITRNYPRNSLLAWRLDAQDTASKGENSALIQEAVDKASQADLVVLVLGEDEQITREHWGGTKERGGDQATLELTPAQQELSEAIFKTGKPVVVYLMGGRPLSVNQIGDKADAIIEGWYGGQEGGNALAQILVGDVNPSGKLPITFPKSVGQLPLYYNHLPSAQFFNYSFQDDKPLYPFGYGLSYTSFKYGDIQTPQGIIVGDKSITVSFKLTNTGSYGGSEVVQMYVHKKVSGVSRPVKELKDFAKVYLKPGETKTVTFLIDQQKLEYWGINRKFEAEPGIYQISIGGSSLDNRLSTELQVKN